MANKTNRLLLCRGNDKNRKMNALETGRLPRICSAIDIALFICLLVVISLMGTTGAAVLQRSVSPVNSSLVNQTETITATTATTATTRNAVISQLRSTTKITPTKAAVVSRFATLNRTNSEYSPTSTTSTTTTSTTTTPAPPSTTTSTTTTTTTTATPSTTAAATVRTTTTKAPVVIMAEKIIELSTTQSPLSLSAEGVKSVATETEVSLLASVTPPSIVSPLPGPLSTTTTLLTVLSTNTTPTVTVDKQLISSTTETAEIAELAESQLPTTSLILIASLNNSDLVESITAGPETVTGSAKELLENIVATTTEEPVTETTTEVIRRFDISRYMTGPASSDTSETRAGKSYPDFSQPYRRGPSPDYERMYENLVLTTPETIDFETIHRGHSVEGDNAFNEAEHMINENIKRHEMDNSKEYSSTIGDGSFNFSTPTLDEIKENATSERNSSVFSNNHNLETNNYAFNTDEIKNNGTNGEHTNEKYTSDPANGNGTSLNLPNAAEVWALAGMKNVQSKKSRIGEFYNVTTDLKSGENDTVSTKLLADWSEIMKSVDVESERIDKNAMLTTNTVVAPSVLPHPESEFIQQENKIVAQQVSTTPPLPEKENDISYYTLPEKDNKKEYDTKMAASMLSSTITGGAVTVLPPNAADKEKSTSQTVEDMAERTTVSQLTQPITQPSSISEVTMPVPTNTNSDFIDLVTFRDFSSPIENHVTNLIDSMSSTVPTPLTSTHMLPDGGGETTVFIDHNNYKYESDEVTTTVGYNPTTVFDITTDYEANSIIPIPSTTAATERIITTTTDSASDISEPIVVPLRNQTDWAPQGLEPEPNHPDDDQLVDETIASTTISTTEYFPPVGNPQTADGADINAIIAISVSTIGVVALVLLVGFLFVMRKRQKHFNYGQRCRPVGFDTYSLDNVSVFSSVRRKANKLRFSKSSYGNSAFEDPDLKSNVLHVQALASFAGSRVKIFEEFKNVPLVTARADEVPPGCEDKNRYANVVPLPETRVHLKQINNDEKTEYINANFVKGPKDNSDYYIACQAPLENTVADFWRMMWEHNSKVIIMATDLEENGIEKCAEYLPPSAVLDCNRTFGDFQVTLKIRDPKEKYAVSTVHLKNMHTNTWREITHFWYQWPETGVPSDEASIIAMLLEARSYSKMSAPEQWIDDEDGGDVKKPMESPEINDVDKPRLNGNDTLDKLKSLQRTQGPLTVHCSPGTGRTGTIIACDIAIRSLEREQPRSVDVPQIVYYVRRGRASSVRSKEQYELIYKVANCYATKLTGAPLEN